jgi:hypothetical protein
MSAVDVHRDILNVEVLHAEFDLGLVLYAISQTMYSFLKIIFTAEK